MAGYTRQSVADIVNGTNITAPPLNAEFNQLASAFDSTTGHSHDGSTGSSPKIDLTTSITGYLPASHGGNGGKNNTTATANPTTSDDFNDGYAPGSVWLNATNGRVFFCVTNTINNAVWAEALAITPNNRITAEVSNTVDIGSSVYQFKDIYIDGTGYIDNVSGDTFTFTSNGSIGGNLTLTGNLVQSGNNSTTGTGYFGGNLTANADLAVNGTLNAAGDVNLGNATTDTVTFISRVDSSILPSADGTYNLGSPTQEWQDIHIDGTAEIDQLNADSVDINSGNIDNTAIGAGTPASAAFSGLTASGTVNFGSATVSNLGSVTTADINGGSIDGVTIGTNSAVTDLRVDNLKLDGNTVTTTNTNGNIDLTPNGAGEVNISKVDIDSGTIDNTVIGSSSPVAASFTTVATSGQATLATVDINGGAIDGTAIGASTPSSGVFTTLSASGGITGDITGNITGNTSGTHTGAVVGGVTGDVSGNVTASSGSSTFNNVTINGTLDVTSTVISNVSDPVADADAANKSYVDTAISDLIGGAPGALDTLNELADALNDDANAYATLDAKINTKLTKAGDTMSGVLAMGSNKITNVSDPTANQDASTKAYTDAQRDTRVAKSGDTMSGDLAMGSNKITGLATPTAATDASTKDYVDTILGSTLTAATSAANAATSETNAANSASAASTSETNAASSATAAAASYDSFDDRYLGAKSSAPTVDNDGDALITGALYFNTATDTMQVYGSTGWVPAGSSVNGTSARFKYTATAAQTTFSGADDNSTTLAYDSGYLDVYLSGIRLVNGTDFTATSGTSIQLASGASAGDILEVVAYGTFTLSTHYTQADADNAFVNVSGDTMTGDLSFGDSVKAKFGASDDLEIYHNGSASYIEEKGTGSLYIKGTQLRMQATDGTTYLEANDGGALTIKHDGSTKLSTTSTGVDVTGTVSADGLTVQGNATIGLNQDISMDANASGQITIDGNGYAGAIALNTDGMHLYTNSASRDVILGTNETQRFRVAGNGDISFYEDTGTTPKFFWDASAEYLGIGTNNPANPLHVATTGSTYATLRLDAGGNTTPAVWMLRSHDGVLDFRDSEESATRMTLDSSGNVLLGGQTSATHGASNRTCLEVSGTSSTVISNTIGGASSTYMYDTGPTGSFEINHPNEILNKTDQFRLMTNNLERVRVTSSGRFGINTTNPSQTFHVVGSSLFDGYSDSSSVWEAKKNTGISLGSFASGANPTHSWNDASKTYKFSNYNNCLAIAVGGTSNNRQANIQVGHNSSGTYSQYYGPLYLNKLGGTVYANTTSISDERYKSNIENVENALDKVASLNGCTFYRTDVEVEKQQAGVIAQQVEAVLPCAVVYDEEEDKYAVTYSMLSALYVEAFKELKTKTEQLEAENSTQAAQIADLIARVSELEKK